MKLDSNPVQWYDMSRSPLAIQGLYGLGCWIGYNLAYDTLRILSVSPDSPLNDMMHNLHSGVHLSVGSWRSDDQMIPGCRLSDGRHSMRSSHNNIPPRRYVDLLFLCSHGTWCRYRYYSCWYWYDIPYTDPRRHCVIRCRSGNTHHHAQYIRLVTSQIVYDMMHSPLKSLAPHGMGWSSGYSRLGDNLHRCSVYCYSLHCDRSHTDRRSTHALRRVHNIDHVYQMMPGSSPVL